MSNIDTAEVDRLLQTLTGVVRARVRLAESTNGLTEIHVLSDGSIAPKQIVRNIETLLKTAFDVSIDHRIVSIAVLKEDAQLIRKPAPEAPERESKREVPVPEVEVPRTRPPSDPKRIVFQRLRVVQDESLRCTATVELKLGDIIFEGTHSDADTPKARVYSAARAVIEAMGYLSEREMAFFLADLERLNLDDQEMLIVMVEGRHHLNRVRMVGSAAVQGDPQEAAVKAVLDAVNRFIDRPNSR